QFPLHDPGIGFAGGGGLLRGPRDGGPRMVQRGLRWDSHRAALAQRPLVQGHHRRVGRLHGGVLRILHFFGDQDRMGRASIEVGKDTSTQKVKVKQTLTPFYRSKSMTYSPSI